MADDKVKKKTKKGADVYDNLEHSTQTFDRIGLVEAVQGSLILRGRNGERDHIYPLERAIPMYYHAVNMYTKLARYGVRGWDTLMEIVDDFRAKILEAITQMRSDNIEPPERAIEFEKKERKE